MILQRNSLAVRLAYFGEVVPEQTNLCPFFWRIVLKPSVGPFLALLMAIVCVCVIVVISPMALWDRIKRKWNEGKPYVEEAYKPLPRWRVVFNNIINVLSGVVLGLFFFVAAIGYVLLVTEPFVLWYQTGSIQFHDNSSFFTWLLYTSLPLAVYLFHRIPTSSLWKVAAGMYKAHKDQVCPPIYIVSSAASA